MKKILIAILTVAYLVVGCKKDDDEPNNNANPVGGPIATVLGQPIPGIFTWNEDANSIGYLRTDDFGGSIYTGFTGNTYPMEALTEEQNCRIELLGEDLDNGPIVYGVHMPGTEDWWIPIEQGTVNGDTELVLKQDDLGIDSMPSLGGYWCWIRHDKGSVNGHPVYAMESYTYPAMYWSLSTTSTCGNCIKLTQHQEPASAQGFIFR